MKNGLYKARKETDRENGEVVILIGMKLMEVEDIGMNPRLWLEHQVIAAICWREALEKFDLYVGVGKQGFDLEHALFNIQAEITRRYLDMS